MISERRVQDADFFARWMALLLAEADGALLCGSAVTLAADASSTGNVFAPPGAGTAGSAVSAPTPRGEGGGKRGKVFRPVTGAAADRGGDSRCVWPAVAAERMRSTAPAFSADAATSALSPPATNAMRATRSDLPMARL